MRKEDNSHVSLKLAHEFVTLIKFLMSFTVTSKLLCPRGGVKSQLLLTRHARILVLSCSPKHSLLKLAGDGDHSSECDPPFFWPSLLDKFRAPLHLAQFQAFGALFLRKLFLFWLTVPIPPRHCKEPSCKLFLARFQREELILCKDSSVPCMAALKTLHLNSNSTFLPELTPASATRSRLRSFVFPSVAKDMFQVKRLSKYPTFVFEFPARIPCHAACVRLICTNCDPPPRATTTFSSFFKFCAMPIAAIALQNCSFSSAAYDKIVRTSSAIRIFACRGRGSLQPRGSLHFLPGACSAGISSSGGEF